MNLYGAGIKIMVNDLLPPNTMVVSSDLYEQLKATTETKPAAKEGK